MSSSVSVSIVKSTKSTGIKQPIIRLVPILPQSKFLILPLIIYSQIFKYLTPQDLYSLSSLCKKLRNLLWSDKKQIQEIWKSSRMYNLTYPSLPPPSNMIEQQYIWLALLAMKCQFCNNSYNRFGYNVWIKKEVLCSKCFSEKTLLIRDKAFPNYLPQGLLYCIPYTNFMTWSSEKLRAYWISDIKLAKKEYLALKTNKQRKDWMSKKQKETKEIMRKANAYDRQDYVAYFNNLY
ncbi:17482_t:CDS:2 [Funneliformis caledonium]|uniref:17482_t:CDS:1 n=2 Tax=Funneliformis TaxID=1117308 RepID=A0A9N9H027_9GLOM|nr:8803_t:CDS:2 [Funneliformis mosseae]CAG8637445.1 17482_t:CDS:2 [Funneliformis caledonium]